MSTGKHGPVSPSVYEMRPDATDRASAVPEYTLILVVGCVVPARARVEMNEP